MLYLAWLLALGASLGALFIGEVMGQTPCVLCWYQRACMFPLAIVLAIGAFREDAGVWRYALPLAAIGALIALYHTLFYAGVITEGLAPCVEGVSCADAAMTILGWLPIPYVSLATFLAIGVLLTLFKRSLRA